MGNPDFYVMLIPDTVSHAYTFILYWTYRMSICCQNRITIDEILCQAISYTGLTSFTMVNMKYERLYAVVLLSVVR